MQVRFSDEYWGALDVKLAKRKRADMSFFYVITLIIISVLLYLGIVHFNQKDNKLDSINASNSVVK